MTASISNKIKDLKSRIEGLELECTTQIPYGMKPETRKGNTRLSADLENFSAVGRDHFLITLSNEMEELKTFVRDQTEYQRKLNIKIKEKMMVFREYINYLKNEIIKLKTKNRVQDNRERGAEDVD